MNFFGKKNSFKGLSIGKSSKFKGSGSALGGSRPGKVFSVIFPTAGPLGMTIEKTEYGGAVVSKVEPSGPSHEAGIQRGDVVCWSGTGGEEAPFAEFMAIVKEGERPLEIDIKRLEVATTNASNTSSSAAAESRRLAVIAAADARAKKSKQQQKPIPKRPIDLKNNTKTYDHSSDGPKSDAAAKAVAAAKANEANLANELGYNPFETVKMGSVHVRALPRPLLLPFFPPHPLHSNN
ncbi:hypothetical protein TrVE_jg14512 [Triparma verrucosa]|uniref:PDZ domain-containing protein n=1 Tax=Triparma verrucosa TaxID=1606542 RepID=A0A9W6ZAJ4_9STRA|nr:hypothetical protein TrVE_jg14512 [Triparma verrucosa]